MQHECCLSHAYHLDEWRLPSFHHKASKSHKYFWRTHKKDYIFICTKNVRISLNCTLIDRCTSPPLKMFLNYPITAKPFTIVSNWHRFSNTTIILRQSTTHSCCNCQKFIEKKHKHTSTQPYTHPSTDTLTIKRRRTEK